MGRTRGHRRGLNRKRRAFPCPLAAVENGDIAVAENLEGPVNPGLAGEIVPDDHRLVGIAHAKTSDGRFNPCHRRQSTRGPIVLLHTPSGFLEAR